MTNQTSPVTYYGIFTGHRFFDLDLDYITTDKADANFHAYDLRQDGHKVTIRLAQSEQTLYDYLGS